MGVYPGDGFYADSPQMTLPEQTGPVRREVASMNLVEPSLAKTGDDPACPGLAERLCRYVLAHRIQPGTGEVTWKLLFVMHLRSPADDRTAGEPTYEAALAWNRQPSGGRCFQIAKGEIWRRKSYFPNLRILPATRLDAQAFILDRAPHDEPDELVGFRVDVQNFADLVMDLRDKIDLPAQDLAHMCGVQRRQFYNLMKDHRPSLSSERHIRLVHAFATKLHRALEERADLVRAAVLTPLGEEPESFYEAAVAQDEGRLRTTYDRLRRAIEQGALSLNVLPPSGRLRADHPAWSRAGELLRARGSEEPGSSPGVD
jgi:hypothetical protein